MNEIKERIDYLTDIINKWSKAYYQDNEPIVSDAIFDQHFQELQKLEDTYEIFKRTDSPTQNVQGYASAMFAKVKHFKPMLSLKTVTDYTINGAKEFTDRMSELLSDDPMFGPAKVDYIAELKYDGLGIDLKYVDGRLQSAVTRGDGDIGEDVTHNLAIVDFVPKVLKAPYPSLCHVRGEILMPKASFDKVNALAEAQGNKKFVNPRNAAAGLMRRKVPDIETGKVLQLLVYQFFFEDSEFKAPTSQSKMISYLGTHGFHSGFHTCTSKLSELWNFHELVAANRSKYEYEVDGVVYKVDNFNLQNKLGYISREPRWAVAHKFPPEEAVTTLLSIDTQVGRTGAITPVAKITPTYVGGTTISSITLHNVFDLRRRGVRVGDRVIVRRAGDVIPEIVKDPTFVRTHYTPNFRIGKTCPCCGGPVVRSKKEVKYYCTHGYSCPAQVKGKLEHFVSRETMNIYNMGSSLISKLVDSGKILKLPDIYKLTKEDILSIDGYEEKSASRVMASIEKSKQTTATKFITALGIKHVGRGVVSDLFSAYEEFENIFTDSINDRLVGSRIGPEIRASLKEFFSDEENQKMIEEMFELGVTFKSGEPKGTSLNGKTFAITGSFDGTSRNHIRDLISNNGGKYVSGVSKSTNYLIAGKDAGDKLNVAKSTGTPVITLAEFIAMV